jgi:hypothetical protein
MKSPLRFLALAALVVVALGAIGYAASERGGGNDTTTLRGIQPVDGVDDVIGSIDRVLGREPAPMPPVRGEEGSAKAAPDRDLGGPAYLQSGGAVGPAADGPAASTQSDPDRKIVQTASIRLQVRQVGESFEEVGRIATASGGFVASSSFSYQGDVQVASVTIRVPADRYQSVLSEIRGLAVRVDAEGSNASDVTEEYSDLGARLRSLEATEAQLFQLLGRANSVNEILLVQDRLNGVRTEIERVKGRMNLLDKLSDMATITVHLRPAVGAAKADGKGIDLGRVISEAWESSLEFLGGIIAGVLSVAVFSWWIVLLAVPAFLLLQRWLRTRPRPPAPAAYD